MAFAVVEWRLAHCLMGVVRAPLLYTLVAERRRCAVCRKTRVDPLPDSILYYNIGIVYPTARETRRRSLSTPLFASTKLTFVSVIDIFTTT